VHNLAQNSDLRKTVLLVDPHIFLVVRDTTGVERETGIMIESGLGRYLRPEHKRIFCDDEKGR